MKQSKKIAIIGGSGVYKMEGIELIAEHDISTPYGKPSAPVKEFKIEDYFFYFIPRHGENHIFTPTEVNYCANIYSLKMLGVDTIISVSAVGSLNEKCPPTSFVFPDQFIDRTKGKRASTFFHEGLVGHVSCADPIEKSLKDRLYQIAQENNIPSMNNGTYLCIEGPQFSTKAESHLYRSWGATIIGMTNVPESYLAKEAGMAYATIAMVTDFDCWKEEHCSVEEIMKVAKQNNINVQKIIKQAIPNLIKNPIEFTPENNNAVMTSPEIISYDDSLVLNLLLK